MATFPPKEPDAQRDHPLLAVGVIVAILLAALLALPFLPHARHHPSRQAVSTTPPGTTAPVAATPDRHF